MTQLKTYVHNTKLGRRVVSTIVNPDNIRYRHVYDILGLPRSTIAVDQATGKFGVYSWAKEVMPIKKVSRAKALGRLLGRGKTGVPTAGQILKAGGYCFSDSQHNKLKLCDKVNLPLGTCMVAYDEFLADECHSFAADCKRQYESYIDNMCTFVEQAYAKEASLLIEQAYAEEASLLIEQAYAEEASLLLEQTYAEEVSLTVEYAQAEEYRRSLDMIRTAPSGQRNAIAKGQ